MTLFFILSFVCIISSILLITNRNPVYSVLSLVLLFVCGSVLLLLLGLDFLPFIFVVVYVGAVAVLFLFVVIILDIKLAREISNFKQIPLVFITTLITFLVLNFLIEPYNTPIRLKNSSYIIINENWLHYDHKSNLSALGQVLYTEYILHFVIGGLVLLVAIIGAIVLTSRIKTNSLKQKVFKQAERLAYVGKNKKA